MFRKNDPDLNKLKLPGIGKQTAKYLARMGITVIEDLLFHLPLRYQDRTTVKRIKNVTIGEEVVIEGEIQSISSPSGRGRTKLLCLIRDESGMLSIRFFHAFSFLSHRLKTGTRLRCYGQVQFGQKGLEMIHPDFQVIDAQKPSPIDPYLTSVYPLTEGLSQYTVRKIINHALDWMDRFLKDVLPHPVLQQFEFPSLHESFRGIHKPHSDLAIADLMEYKTVFQKRLIFEELLAHRLSMLHIRQLFQHQKAWAMAKKMDITQVFLKKLPFELTNAQSRVLNEIYSDLGQPHPMLRLVQGDVGSGKTIVAALAMLRVVENGYQAALMAPTELLAEQHYRVFKKWFTPFHIEVIFIAGQLAAKQKKMVSKKINDGCAQIVIGTHALFQKEIQFSNLALIVVDEQHRFGVHQRALLREKGLQGDCYPHQLVMTATPIPRTLAMSLYTDLACSTITELPPGRIPVVTSVIPNTRRNDVVARIKEVCQQGTQAYWVCPLIEESEVLDCMAATKTAEQLKHALPELNIGLIHGRMKSEEKDRIMQAFQEGHLHLLVATTVIEVGVDVANASLMIIENAERLGLAQLHQLRGRVGRGTVTSYCLLLYQQPLSALAKERLKVMRETTDGFKIAQRDLELRGPGEVFGIKQTGELLFKIADLMRDNALLDSVHQTAELILRDYPDVVRPLLQRWLGDKNQYGDV
jgi:ATP-dependent DNA helicase RecG